MILIFWDFRTSVGQNQKVGSKCEQSGLIWSASPAALNSHSCSRLPDQDREPSLIRAVGVSSVGWTTSDKFVECLKCGLASFVKPCL
ncbi:hypothetical protein PoB_004651900 [Plakobranchus ocellatus]|uniref:Uncharacterized protein n=1 Tax=Plakobranchus ocellatus TaxID=259542 RepID=A0AAV4BIS9_9GAST|nr:hypothetical protein PoB_004651900 [Plakobranchus ocellatus]